MLTTALIFLPVAVRDFRRHKTILVKTGKSYLAKAPGA
jgi:hypothetical protein